MKPEHKRYILENIGKKSIKGISQELGLKEKHIRRFLEKQSERERTIETKKDSRTPTINISLVLSVLLIVILGLVAYSNAIKDAFIWDDYHLVKDNVYIRNWTAIPQIFSQDLGAGAGMEFSFYRPIQMITYMVDYSLWGLNAKVLHLSNILLHIFVALSIYWFIYILFKDRVLSLITGILFVVHPIHTEAVSYISGRADSLAALFMFFSLICYIKYINTRKGHFYILVLLTCILALLSRENAIILPVLFLLYHYTFKRKLERNRFLPIVGIVSIYIILRFTILQHILADVSYDTTLFQRLPGTFVALVNYIRLLILPFDLHMEYGKELFSYFDLRAMLGLIILLALLIYIFRNKGTNKVIFFSVSWFLVTLFPMANIYPINAYMAEHWLYVPSIGFFLIIAKLFSMIYARKRLKALVILLVSILVIFYAHLTFDQNNYWTKPLTFYKRTLQYAPHSWRVQNSLGVMYNEIGQNDKAIEALKRSIELKSDYASAYCNLGAVYAMEGDLEQAIVLFEKAKELREDYDMTHYNLGKLYVDTKRPQKAIASYKRALEINPNNAATHNNLAVLYYYREQYDLAIKHGNKAFVLGFNVDPRFLEELDSHRK